MGVLNKYFKIIVIAIINNSIIMCWFLPYVLIKIPMLKRDYATYVRQAGAALSNKCLKRKDRHNSLLQNSYY